MTEIKFLDFKEKVIDKEGIVLLGTGGDLNEWVEGVINVLFEEGISTSNNYQDLFSDIYILKTTGGRTDTALVFNGFDNFNMGKMAMWRLRFGDCSWISDYLDNYAEQHVYLEDYKPACKLVGTDGNVFSIIGKVSETLKKAGMPEKAKEFEDRAFNSGSYDEVLQLCFEYVDVE